MTDLHTEIRRLRAEVLRAQEDRDQARERLAYALRQVAELGRRIRTTVQQAAAPGSGTTRETDPLVRFMEALRPPEAT